MSGTQIIRTVAEVEASLDALVARQSELQALVDAGKDTQEIRVELERVEALADSEFELLDLMGAFNPCNADIEFLDFISRKTQD